MDSGENSLYFLTARGKGFYNRLKNNADISLTGLNGYDTMSGIAVSLRGRVKELGAEKVTELFEKNPYMYEIYPDENARSAITVFQIYEGTGEWFDLSKKPIERVGFSFGGADVKDNGYFVTDKCIQCQRCYLKCPQKCIDIRVNPVIINQSHCLHCGNCYEICPANAIVKRG